MEKNIRISDDFSRYPIGRDSGDGPFNGERFRTEILAPAFEGYSKVVVWLDGPKSYGSSFLEEAFGGLVRKEGFSLPQLRERLTIKFDAPVYKLYHDEIWEYIAEAAR